jgi:hypothetical protein
MEGKSITLWMMTMWQNFTAWVSITWPMGESIEKIFNHKGHEGAQRKTLRGEKPLIYANSLSLT